MIHDAYTREYDHRERQRRLNAMMQLVGKTAHRLGCRVELREESVRLVAVMPQKDVEFARFATLEQAALVCREKWPM